MIASGQSLMDVIDLQGVTRRFGRKTALREVTLRVPRGSVFGLVGANGSGKTTLIRHVLGLLRPDAGSVRVFGLDPVRDPVGVLSGIGYLSEENDLPGWMRVDELIRYTRAFYPRWQDDYAEELRRAFALPGDARLGTLSKGQQARAGLLAALAHRPELLVLDEPSSGLDPLVRRDILGAIVRTISDEGRTALFSSHLLDELERVADHVAMIDEGRIVFCASLEELQQTHRRLIVRFEGRSGPPPELPAVLSWEPAGAEWVALCQGRPEDLRATLTALGGRVIEEHGLRLDEIFLAHAGRLASAGQGR